ncbi:MAG: hypothetical protein ABIB04_02225 [Patescibacteria group bacterium]
MKFKEPRPEQTKSRWENETAIHADSIKDIIKVRFVGPENVKVRYG